jgi:hypothetical protein
MVRNVKIFAIKYELGCHKSNKNFAFLYTTVRSEHVHGSL